MANLVTRRTERYYSDHIVDELAAEQAAVVRRMRQADIVPHLGVVLAKDHVGEIDGASASYVGRKEQHGRDIGALTTLVRCGRPAVNFALSAFNANSRIHGSMLQLDIPKYPGEDDALQQKVTKEMLAQIAPRKDVDGLRPENPGYPAATPLGIMRLLGEQDRVPVKPGVNALVVGAAGYLIGRHMRPLFEAKGITPVEHDPALYKTHPTPEQLEEDLRAKVKEADIVVSSVGRPGLITPDMLHDDMVVVDAGTRRVDGKMRGDLDPTIKDASLNVLYTGPTRGVGPLTVVELWQNTLHAAQQSL